MAENIRIGIVGADTSHAEQFALRLNDPANPNHIPGGRVIAAFPAASADLPESAGRVEGYTAALRDKFGVKIMGSIAELCAAVDAVMILSLDGRPHLAQVTEVISSGKPFFLDKPVAATLQDVVTIYKLAATAKVPFFSASAVRWWPGVVEVAAAGQNPARAAFSYGPSPVLPHHPDLFFYGVHPTEALFVTMGSGCLSVSRTTTPNVSVVTGVWEGDRVGTLFALHAEPVHSTNYNLTRFGEQGIVTMKSQGDYSPMLREVIKFFETKQPPVSARQTLEIYGFMEAADESKRQGGRPVSLRDVLIKAGAPEEWLHPLPAPPAPPPAPPSAEQTPQTPPKAAAPSPGEGTTTPPAAGVTPKPAAAPAGGVAPGVTGGLMPPPAGGAAPSEGVGSPAKAE